MSRRGGLSRAVAALSALATAAGLAASSATAHTEVISTRPATGASVSALPGRIVVSFSEALGRAGDASLTSGAGEVALEARLHPRDARRLVISATGDAIGPVRVAWSALSADGHEIAGEARFTVRAPSLRQLLAPVLRDLRRAAWAITR